MNPNPQNVDAGIEIEFIFRRLLETFSIWTIFLPVLFAVGVLFVIACMRKEKGGMATLGWGMCMLVIVPMLLVLRPKDPVFGNYWGDLALKLACDFIAGLMVGGFMMNLIKEITGFFLPGLIVGLLCVPVYMGAWAGINLPLELPVEVKIVPIIFLFLVQFLFTVIQARLWWGLFIVGGCSLLYLPLAWQFKPYFSWWVVLLPILFVALFYVGMMYVKDAKSIHPVWAGFLGLLRCAVYAILAFVFLLPGCQLYDEMKTFPVVVVLFDTSGSMLNTKDDLLEPGQKPETLLTRQDKVVKFLTTRIGPDKKDRAEFVQRLLEKSPIHAYRFGQVADEENILKFDGFKEGDKLWTAQQWNQWLRPKKELSEEEVTRQGEEMQALLNQQAEDLRKVRDEARGEMKKNHEKALQEMTVKHQTMRAKREQLFEDLVMGTNVPGSAAKVAKTEAANFVQAIIIVSDGQSNVGSSESVKDFLVRVNNRKRPIHVFTIGVGGYRQPANIRIDELQAPQIARPDDKFPVRVPVVGIGLGDEEFDVVLRATRIKDANGNPTKGEKIYEIPASRKGKFKVSGEFPQDTVEFEIDVQDLKKIKAADDSGRELEGEWEFIALVPKHPSESFAEPQHVSNPPTRVLVQNKELRVLLFAGGPTRDYQFLRTMLYRESLEKRVELSIFLQTGPAGEGIDQDVDRDRLLKHFPNKLGKDNPDDKYSSFNMYDVIIAIDPDWTALEPSQIKMLEQWVGREAGGFVFVAGPVSSFHLARTREDLQPLKTILPVNLKDYRLAPLGLGLGIDMTRPYVLNFPPAAKGYDFLKLDDNPDNPLEGWNSFFWGEGKKAPAGVTDPRPVRGFYNYYPVDSLRGDYTVLATFAGPPATRINDGKDEQPYIVTMRYGTGKTVYIGSTESHRLRQYKESFHERFWIKLARFAASGSTQQKTYGRIVMAQRAKTGSIPIEATLKGADLLPLSRDARPIVMVKKGDAKPETFELKARKVEEGNDWHGQFSGVFKVREAGEYELSIQIPETSESLSHRLIVDKPNLEEANVRENFKDLYQISTDAKPILDRLSGKEREKMARMLQPITDDIKGGVEEKRLFFPLASADDIPDYLLKQEPKVDQTKGALLDLWDQGSGVSLFHLMWSVPLGLCLLFGSILLFHQRWLLAGIALGLALLIPASVLVVHFLIQPEWLTVRLDFSFVLVGVVSLLALEWLTRKLLKLA